MRRGNLNKTVMFWSQPENKPHCILFEPEMISFRIKRSIRYNFPLINNLFICVIHQSLPCPLLLDRKIDKNDHPPVIISVVGGHVMLSLSPISSRNKIEGIYESPLNLNSPPLTPSDHYLYSLFTSPTSVSACRGVGEEIKITSS